eukprot:15119543-Alexandrium_andersonii.AAC.1
MSASLVGSEMCIRDRGTSGGAAAPPGDAPGAFFLTAKRDCLVHEKAVSYTHLTLPTICSV